MSEALFDIFDATARFHADGRMVPSPGRVVQVHADALLAVRARVGPEAAWLLLEIAVRAVVDPASGKVVAETSAERLADELRTGLDREHPGWSRKSVLNHLRALVEAGFVIREQTLSTDAGRAGRKSWSTTRLVLSDRLTAVPDTSRTPVVGTAQARSGSAVPIRDAAGLSAVPDRDGAGIGTGGSAVPGTDGAETPSAEEPPSVVPSSVVPKSDSAGGRGARAGGSAGPSRVGGGRDDNNNGVGDDALHHQHVQHHPRRPVRRDSSGPAVGSDPTLVGQVLAGLPADASAGDTSRLALAASSTDERVWAGVISRARALGYTGSVEALQAHTPGRVLAWVAFLEANPKKNNGGFLRAVLREADTWPPDGPGPLLAALDTDGLGVHLVDALGAWTPGQAGAPAPGRDVTAPAPPTAGASPVRAPGVVTTQAIFAAMEHLDAANGGDPHPVRARVNTRMDALMEAGLRRDEAFKRAAVEALAELGVPGWAA